jgi:hypothetical protein
VNICPGQSAQVQKEDVEGTFTEKGFVLFVKNIQGKTFELKISNLANEIDPENSIVKCLSTKVLINMAKKEEKTWFELRSKK